MFGSQHGITEFKCSHGKLRQVNLSERMTYRNDHMCSQLTPFLTRACEFSFHCRFDSFVFRKKVTEKLSALPLEASFEKLTTDSQTQTHHKHPTYTTFTCRHTYTHMKYICTHIHTHEYICTNHTHTHHKYTGCTHIHIHIHYIHIPHTHTQHIHAPYIYMTHSQTHTHICIHIYTHNHHTLTHTH